ncbi:MAG: two-component system, OmpR family, operon response regulator KdpE [Chloroflexota bacterium]|nr:two-component system, OmpR family, operon response regulator KdpE [Chloroflexota bacterium]
MKILIVDDDQQVLDALTVGMQLQWQDCTVITATDGELGLTQFATHNPDVVLLDITMPKKDGFEVLQEIRSVSDAPVIMVTGHTEEMAQVRGLELGADGYITKPFSHLALQAQIRAVLRRAAMPPPVHARPDYVAGSLAIDFEAHRVTLCGERVKLTQIEYELLAHLVRHAGRLIPHRALLDCIWGPNDEATTAHLKVFVSRLRAKIEPDSGVHYIETERGLGYRFVAPGSVVAERERVVRNPRRRAAHVNGAYSVVLRGVDPIL